MDQADDDQAEDQSGIRCIICRDPRLEEIDKLLQTPRKERAVSREFGFSRVTIRRHKSHMASELQGNDGELPDFDALIQECEALKAKAKSVKERLDCISQIRALKMDKARVLQDLGTSSSPTSHPAWHAFLRWLLETISGCDNCTSAVLARTQGDTR